MQSGLLVDIGLVFGLLVVLLISPYRWTEVYWVVIGTGLAKTFSTGLAAYLSCRAQARRHQPRS